MGTGSCVPTLYIQGVAKNHGSPRRCGSGYRNRGLHLQDMFVLWYRDENGARNILLKSCVENDLTLSWVDFLMKSTCKAPTRALGPTYGSFLKYWNQKHSRFHI